MMYQWDGAGWGIGPWLVMAAVMLVVGGAVAVAMVVLARGSYSGRGGLTPHHDAERILTERFARGEIDEQEFLARRAALRSPD
ncbi:SHOCT domain-containing protein [Arthrobacter sp. SDTb3-6]|uniref:SHOCT domain-containing protein n=1 Tax=Arthrobacter sp. SDTb3-6 TaxID=2713571 RepID=UPI00159CF998|nr:SHOCT domain-containing protein [Arthrobacter sp. SDTb3-6]NVM99804.1 SHOCT domain-containing protein [Arthrobacter sp. SDTb3-6]